MHIKKKKKLYTKVVLRVQKKRQSFKHTQIPAAGDGGHCMFGFRLVGLIMRACKKMLLSLSRFNTATDQFKTIQHRFMNGARRRSLG